MNGTLSGFIALLIWSTTAALIGLVGRLPPLEVTAFTWLIASLSLAGFFMAKGENIWLYVRRPLSDYLFVTLSMGIYTALYYMAFKYAPAFEANTLNYLWPIFLMLFISLFQKAPVTIFTISGMIFGFFGSLLLFLTHSEGASFGTFNIGHIMAIGASIIWALYSCFSRNKRYPVGFLIPVFIISGIGTFACHFLFENWVTPGPAEWGVIFLLGFARLGYAFWDYGMRHGNQVLVTSASYFTPLSSTLILILFGFGTTNPAIACAAALIIAGCLIVNGDKIKNAFLKFRPGQLKP